MSRWFKAITVPLAPRRASSSVIGINPRQPSRREGGMWLTDVFVATQSRFCSWIIWRYPAISASSLQPGSEAAAKPAVPATASRTATLVLRTVPARDHPWLPERVFIEISLAAGLRSEAPASGSKRRDVERV